VALDLLRDAEWFAEHLAFIRGLYRERAHTLIEALTDRFGERVAIAPVRGGLFAWVRFVDGTDTDELFERAVGRGVAFVPGSAFTLDGGHRDTLRLCFASLPPASLVDAVDRLHAAAVSLSGSGEGADQVDHGDHEPEDDHDEAQLLRR